MKFTPGPWTINGREDVVHEVKPCDEVPYGGEILIAGRGDNFEHKANARLIAAAIW